MFWKLDKFFPEVKVFQQACPLWVPLIENNEHLDPGADYFVKKYVDELLCPVCEMDTVLLACTHYPLLMDKLKQYFPQNIQLIAQGDIVAESLVKYLKNHPEIEVRCSKEARIFFILPTIMQTLTGMLVIFMERMSNRKEYFCKDF